MLINEKKQLIRNIIIKIIIGILLIPVDFYLGHRIMVKIDEIKIYNGIITEYPDLIYDKNLSEIAEECAEKCYSENLSSNQIKILENKDFVRLYSSNVQIAKYTWKCDTGEDFVDKFLTVMKNGKYPATDSCLKKCEYVGIGKFKNQVFILAFYNIDI